MRTDAYRRICLLVCSVVVHVAAGIACAGDEASLMVVAPEGQFTVGDTVTVRVAARGGIDAMWGELSVQVSEDGPWASFRRTDRDPGQ